MGLEWLYRLIHDPKRLFERYCIEPWFLIPVALSDIALALKAGRLLKGPPRTAPAAIVRP